MFLIERAYELILALVETILAEQEELGNEKEANQKA
tara:strand:+ start:469 stop:576 length:108 start_codon:yes stop_codon:yes gene_type:complete